MPHPFHLAVPVHDLDAARAFYGDVLGCTPGRSSQKSIVWNFHGHQVVTHQVEGYTGGPAGTNAVDKHAVPVPHFGLAMPMAAWKDLVQRVTGHVDFVIEPDVRYKGTSGEQATMFFRDPSGNALEFKGFENLEAGLFSPWTAQDGSPA